MKIGLVCPYIYPEAGGVAQHVRFLYENLRLAGHDVRIITASHGPQRSSEGDIIRLGIGFSVRTNGSVGTLTFSPRYISQVRRMLAEERFDLLHFHEPFVPFLSLFLLRESTSVNVATFHAYAGFSPSYELGSRVMRGHAARLHGRIAVSAAARHFIDRFFPGDYKVIPNGVDVPRYANAVPIARWQDGTPNLLFVGRHEPRKGLLHLLKAQRILRKAGYGTRLLVVGSGPQEREARRYVATRGLQGVVFLGRVTDAEKAQLFRTADIYVSPATGGESFGIVLLEAMAAGTPIVASDIHGYKGVVRRGREGLLVPPRDPKGIADAIMRLLDDPELRAQMGAAGQARAEDFSWPQGHGEGGGVLRVRDPPARRERLPAGRVPGRGASGAAAGPCQGVRVVRRRHIERLGPGHPPRPGGVGDHEAGDRDGHGQHDEHRREERRRDAPVDGTHRELERVQVGRQDALVGGHDRGRQRQGRDVRIEDREPAHGRDAEADDEPTRVTRTHDLDRQVGQRQQHDQGDRLDRDVGQGQDRGVRQQGGDDQADRHAKPGQGERGEGAPAIGVARAVRPRPARGIA